MDNKKDVRIEIRVSKSEKEMFKQYAEAHNMTLSELVRMLLLNKINQ